MLRGYRAPYLRHYGDFERLGESVAAAVQRHGPEAAGASSAYHRVGCDALEAAHIGADGRAVAEGGEGGGGVSFVDYHHKSAQA